MNFRSQSKGCENYGWSIRIQEEWNHGKVEVEMKIVFFQLNKSTQPLACTVLWDKEKQEQFTKKENTSK